LKMVDEYQVDESSSNGTDCGDGLGSCFLGHSDSKALC
jgi:hypothetical protein